MTRTPNTIKNNKNRAIVKTGALLLAGGMALTACGNSESNQPAPGNTQPVATASPSSSTGTETHIASPSGTPEKVVIKFDSDKIPVEPKTYEEARETLEYLIDKPFGDTLRSKVWEAIEGNDAEYFNKLSISKEDFEANLHYYEEYVKTIDLLAERYKDTPEAQKPLKSIKLIGQSSVIILNEALSRNDLVSKLQPTARDLTVNEYTKRVHADPSPLTADLFVIASIGKDPEAWSAGYKTEDGTLKQITDDMVIVQEQLKFKPSSTSAENEALSIITYTVVSKLGSLCIAKQSGFDTHCDAETAVRFAE